LNGRDLALNQELLGERAEPKTDRTGRLAGRGVLAIAVLVTALLWSVSRAEASTETYVFRSGPYTISPYQVARGKDRVKTPEVDGYITHMDSYVVDADGNRMPVQQVMLHHDVFMDLGTHDSPRTDGYCGFTGERFYGTGEEQQQLRLPEGYGYRIRAGDHWALAWMLMNHQALTHTAYIEYRVTVETERHLTPVKPYWAGVVDCRWGPDPIWNVRGGGPPGSVSTRARTWTVPQDGRIVAGGAHLHGGAEDLAISQVRCHNRRLFGSRPRYGLPSHPYYHVLPVLHEPGPIDTTWLMSEQGIQVSKGDRLRITAKYDDQYPHTRVMGFMRLYMAPPSDNPSYASCPPLPEDRSFLKSDEPGRDEPPRVITPLTAMDRHGVARTILAPPGNMFRADKDVDVDVKQFAYSRPNISIPAGATVRWRFDGLVQHNVSLANGPEGFGSRYLSDGRIFRKRFTKPGVYRSFCSLHPILMTERIVVRPEAPKVVPKPPGGDHPGPKKPA
jgi:plastocyanin